MVKRPSHPSNRNENKWCSVAVQRVATDQQIISTLPEGFVTTLRTAAKARPQRAGQEQSQQPPRRPEELV